MPVFVRLTILLSVLRAMGLFYNDIKKRLHIADTRE
jgi:hypothetical protein